MWLLFQFLVNGFVGTNANSDSLLQTNSSSVMFHRLAQLILQKKFSFRLMYAEVFVMGKAYRR
jgi:hypothetical protein